MLLVMQYRRIPENHPRRTKKNWSLTSTKLGWDEDSFSSMKRRELWCRIRLTIQKNVSVIAWKNCPCPRKLCSVYLDRISMQPLEYICFLSLFFCQRSISVPNTGTTKLPAPLTHTSLFDFGFTRALSSRLSDATRSEKYSSCIHLRNRSCNSTSLFRKHHRLMCPQYTLFSQSVVSIFLRSRYFHFRCVR